MQPGAARLANRVQVPDVRATVEICMHTTARKMRRRHHRDRLARDVDAILEAAFVDRRKTLPNEVRLHCREIEQCVRLSARRELLLDRSSDDVTRGERAARI